MGFNQSLIRVVSIAPLYILALIILSSSTLAQYQVRKPAGRQTSASITITDPSGSATWEKGKRYTIKWESTAIRGSVKIDLIDPGDRVTPLVRQTLNNGKYSFTLMQNMADGNYRIRVSSTDGKTFGESAGTVSVSRASKRAIDSSVPPPTESTTKSLAPTSPATRPTSGVALKPGGTAVELVRREFTPMQVSGVELQNLEDSLPNFQVQSGLDVGSLKPINAGGSIEILQPQFRAEWIAGNQVSINWTSEDIAGNVKIDLLQVTSPNIETWFPVTVGTPNDGHHSYTVPSNLGVKRWSFKARVATPDEQVKDFSPNFSMYTEQIDMDCRVADINRVWSRDNYIVVLKEQHWLEFDVLLRNDGTMSPVTVQTVSVRLIKEPEEIVVAHEEWGFSGIYARMWYQTPEPRRFDIRTYYLTVAGQETDDDIPSGAFRLEVEIDPGNQLGEDQALRSDNKVVKWFHLR